MGMGSAPECWLPVWRSHLSLLPAFVYVGERLATVGGFLLGLWPPLLAFIPRLMTEVLAVYLVCGFAFHFARSLREIDRHWVHRIAGPALLAYRMHTRVIFAYASLAIVAILALVLVLGRSRTAGKALVIFVLAFALCIPYLSSTCGLTHGIFCWATSGGLSLCWMASPYDRDLGEWHLPTEVLRNPRLAANHGDFFKSIASLSPIEQDCALKTKALENIRNHPGKFLKNWIANVGGLVLGYPFPDRKHNMGTLLTIIPGMFVAVFSVLAAYPTCVGRHRIPGEVWILMLFGLLAFLASSVLSAYPRLLLPILPVLITWWMVVFRRLIRIEVATSPYQP